MVELGVNIDHVATIRQARKTNEPDPIWAAALAELGGADGITFHLREDRRHIQDRDVSLLKETVALPLNFELACADEVLEIARAGKARGCREALFTLGDKPELRYSAAREALARSYSAPSSQVQPCDGR